MIDFRAAWPLRGDLAHPCYIKLTSPQKYNYLTTFYPGGRRWGGTLYNGLYGEAPPERGTFSRLQVYKRVGILQVEVYKRVEKSVI